MLILGMFRNERIVLQTSDGLVCITLIDTKGPKARLGFDAPASVRIDRENIYLAKTGQGSVSAVPCPLSPVPSSEG